jgi:MFS family permease
VTSGVWRRLLSDVTPLQDSRAFRWLFVGSTVSTVGTQVTQVAVPLQVYALTRSSFLVGLVGFAGLIPLVVLGLYGGAIADAVNRRTLLLLSSVGSAIVSGILVTQAVLGFRLLWLLFVCVAAQAAFFAVSSPTRRAILPQILPAPQIAAANTLQMGVFNLGLVLGPLVAGLLVAQLGYASAYAFDVVSFIVGIVAVIRGLPSLPAAPGSRRPGFASVLEGLHYLRGRRNLLMTFVVDINAMVFGMPRALFPALAVGHFHGGAQAAGYLYAAPAIGGLAVAALGGPVARVRRQGLGVLLAVTAWGASIAAFGLAPWLWLGIVMLAVAGGADSVSAIFRSTMLQVAAPDEMQGRLSGVYTVVVAGGPRLGDLESGTVATLFTPTISAVSGGVFCVLGVAALAALVPSFARYDAHHPVP